MCIYWWWKMIIKVMSFLSPGDFWQPPRLSSSGCIFSTFSINKSAPWGNFTSIYKKNHQKILKTKKVRAKSSSEFFWDDFFEKFRFFSLKIVWKMKKLRSKNFDFFRSQNFSFSYNFQWKKSKFPIFFDLRKFSTWDFGFDLKILPINAFARVFLEPL